MELKKGRMYRVNEKTGRSFHRGRFSYNWNNDPLMPEFSDLIFSGVKLTPSTLCLFPPSRFDFQEMFNPLLAKQIARGLSERITEDCAGIIERMLVGDDVVGKGPDRYSPR